MGPLLPLLGIGAVIALALGGKHDASAAAAHGAPAAHGQFDANLPPQTLQAVMTALATEQDPAKLHAFAQSLLPDFPLAAAALDARAGQLAQGNVAPQAPGAAPPPPPAPVQASTTWTMGKTMLVITQDPSPAGNLIVRATPGGAPTGNTIPRGKLVNAYGATLDGAWTHISDPASGWVSSQYVSDGQPGSPPVPADLLPGGANSPFTPGATLDQAAAAVTQAVQEQEANMSTSAGLDNTMGAATPWADLHSSAMALDTALKTRGCRSYNEPLVKNFQRAAKAAKLYAGDIDGWYDTRVQGALSRVIGNAAPPCFAKPTGGPANPNEYWSPMGA